MTVIVILPLKHISSVFELVSRGSTAHRGEKAAAGM